jgi:hypothetical protein
MTLLEKALAALAELKTVAVYEQDGWDGVGDAETPAKRSERIEMAIRTADRILAEAEKEAAERRSKSAPPRPEDWAWLTR